MTSLAETFDPWGPISVALYEVGNADFVETAVAATGLIGDWRPLNEKEAYSSLTRIRARKPAIGAAYYALPEEHRGVFIQRLLQALFDRQDGRAIRDRLEERLIAIGWGLREDGLLVTQDALVAETFFPPNSQYDAYVSLRDLFAAATTELVVVDNWIGASLLSTLRAVAPQALRVRLVTVVKNLRADFTVELHAFRKQMAGVQIEVRASDDFHDRFVMVDGARCFHIGSSIKDAGSRAFMVSEIEDRANVALVREAIEMAWQKALPL